MNFVSNDDLIDNTYLSLIKKYPEAREDLLNLRRVKNKSIVIFMIVVSVISFTIGVLI